MAPTRLIANGIDALTGAYALPELGASALARLARGGAPPPTRLPDLAERLRSSREGMLGLAPGTDPEDLAQAGWGVVFPRDGDPAVAEALGELLALRREQAGERYRELRGEDGLHPGESKNDFLLRHGVGPGTPDPTRLPFYLLLVGGPEEIPFSLQHQLDVQYGVGRVGFDTVEEYALYAQTVVEAERQRAGGGRHRAVFFGTRHPGDLPTELAADHLVAPLAASLAESLATESLAAESLAETAPAWQVDTLLGEAATRARLRALFDPGETPNLLFAAAHGLAFPCGHPLQLEHQGGLVCQDWPGPGAGRIDRDFYLAAEDLDTGASVRGLILFLFACFGAGTPAEDACHHPERSPWKPLAPAPFLSRLPGRLLAHPGGGALAVIGHVERVWGFSYIWGRAAQPEVFRATLAGLLAGQRAALALDPFNLRYAELATLLSEELDAERRWGKQLDETALAHLWIAHNDARGYVLLGDPAVRLGTDLKAAPTGP